MGQSDSQPGDRRLQLWFCLLPRALYAFVPLDTVPDVIINAWLDSGERLARQQNNADDMGGVLLSVRRVRWIQRGELYRLRHF